MEECYDAVCDCCRTGLAYFKNGIYQGLVKKSTRIRTNFPELAEALDLKCQCPRGEHVQMIGKSAALKDMQNYEPNFVQRAAKAIYNNMENNWRLRQIAQVMVTEELNDEEAERERKAVQQQHRLTEHDRPASLNVVKKLHRQLGHPGNDRLVKALKDANFDETIMKCGRQFRCDICESFAPKKLDRPASLPQTTHFNDMLEMDVFHIKCHGQKHKILASLDLHARYEMNEMVNSESFDEETAALQRWMSLAGVPRRIKTDSSGAHMGEEMQSWCDEYGIKLILVPTDAHNRMGTIERLHAVRRRQLMKMMKENTSLDIRKAVIIACSQRNRLRSIHGISPAAMVLGYTPEDDGICDEPTRLRVDGRQAYMEDQAIRSLATKAFYEANTDATLRQAMLAKTRNDDEPLQVGNYGYYWRIMMDKEASRWRGPALVCAVESRPDGRPDVYWMAHGSSLVRVSHVMARREVPAERTARLEQLPDTAAREPAKQRVVRALRPVRGPIRFLDLAPDGPSVDAEAKAAAETAAAAAMEIKNEAMNQTTAADSKSSIKEEIKTIKRDSAAAELETSNNMDVEQQPAAEVKAEKRERSRSPPKEDETRLRMSQASFDAARRLEGLPPRAATRQELNSNWHGPVDNIDVDDELLAEEFNEKKLSLEEKAQFDEAKDQALRVWIENDAWRPVNMEEADPEETVPARFLQRWSMVNPTLSIETDETLCHSGLSSVLTDAKSLFDASKSITSGIHLTERRTAIEVAIVAERVKVMQAEWKWLNSHQQVADGLTKPSAKDRFAEILQRGNHQLKFDPNFVPAKKVAQKGKDAQERHLQQVATEQVFGLTEDDENKSADLCQSRGCRKRLTRPSLCKFCSRRHFYLNHHQKFGWSDEWSKSAKLAISILAVENASQAEAHMFGDDVLKANTWWKVFTAFAIIFFFAQVFFKVIHVIEHTFEYVRSQLNAPASENIAAFESDITFETKAVQANVRLHAYDMALEEIFLFEENYARPSHGVPIPDEGLWCSTYDEVLNEPDQEMWRKLSSSRHFGWKVWSSSTRLVVCKHC